MTLRLTARDQALLSGDAGEGPALAMRVLTAVARSMRANEMLDISMAHIDSCLYQGHVGHDFVARLAAGGAKAQGPVAS